jgi:hypothetical protein
MVVSILGYVKCLSVLLRSEHVYRHFLIDVKRCRFEYV